MVLCNRALLEQITTFMTRYPYDVGKFYGERAGLELKWDRRLENYSLDGRLSHIAVATNDADMLKLLFKLSRQPRYRHDQKLSFARVMQFAVLHHSMEMLECIAALKDGNPAWQWDPFLMRTALKMDAISFDVLNWLYEHLPRETHPLFVRDMMLHINENNLDVVRWLHERNVTISEDVVEKATKLGHLRTLEYFYEHTTKRCGGMAARYATERGFLDVVELIIANDQLGYMDQHVLNAAASSGQLRIVRYLLENFDTLDTSRLMNLAAESGSLSLVKYLYECYTRKVNSRVEHFAPEVLNNAVRSGNVEVVEFLHENCASLQCLTSAMDAAAARNHLEVVKFLHFNRTEGCAIEALRMVVSNNRPEVVKFLCENRSEGDIIAAIPDAAFQGHLELVKHLTTKLPAELSTDFADDL